MDLSFPHGQSVNDSIDLSLCSLSYTTVDDITDVAAQLGTGALLAKVDIESAYRLVPVHPQDHPLQAIQWDGRIYIGPMFPFGLCSRRCIELIPAAVRNPPSISLPRRLHYCGPTTFTTFNTMRSLTSNL